MVFADLLGTGRAALTFEPFRPGVEICSLWRDGPDGGEWAVLRYQPGASVPRHRHPGMETILVLEGAQSDETGTYRAGDMVCNAPGSVHSVRSDSGCMVLIFWAQPVEILLPD
ncbi:cupin domain-containing protein [Pseudooceanicola aestuarii]|uniref:cupin domain-containing protein n=1 Tax=Pseudooceanicola aestuarii TaxID=2697319 RepID=UPI0013D53145|nr:cupin domain-containing protein [Pseudooceanicola aestuarii]